jgi:hypothetical protein
MEMASGKIWAVPVHEIRARVLFIVGAVCIEHLRTGEWCGSGTCIPPVSNQDRGPSAPLLAAGEGRLWAGCRRRQSAV